MRISAHSELTELAVRGTTSEWIKCSAWLCCCSSVAQSCLTVTPGTVACQAPPSMGSQAGILEWVAVSFSGGDPGLGTEHGSPAWQADCIPLCHLERPAWLLGGVVFPPSTLCFLPQLYWTVFSSFPRLHLLWGFGIICSFHLGHSSSTP